MNYILVWCIYLNYYIVNIKVMIHLKQLNMLQHFPHESLHFLFLLGYCSFLIISIHLAYFITSSIENLLDGFGSIIFFTK